MGDVRIVEYQNHICIVNNLSSKKISSGERNKGGKRE